MPLCEGSAPDSASLLRSLGELHPFFQAHLPTATFSWPLASITQAPVWAAWGEPCPIHLPGPCDHHPVKQGPLGSGEGRLEDAPLL